MFRLLFLFLAPLAVEGGLLDWFSLLSWHQKNAFQRRWSEDGLNYLTASTLTFVSVCDWTSGKGWKGTMQGGEPGLASNKHPNKFCGQACKLLAKTFGDGAGYPYSSSAYSHSDHVNMVCLVPSKTGDDAKVQLTAEGKAADQDANIMLTFRGTYAWDIVNNRRNSEKTLMSTSICTNCAVHSGFWRNYISLKFAILRVTTEATSTKSNAPFTITQKKWKIGIFGHSMGSSLASLSATLFKHTLSRQIVGLYTMGQPRLGNLIFANFVKSSARLTAQLQNSRDPIPHSGRFQGYRHPPGRIFELFMDPVYTTHLMSGDVDVDYKKYLFFIQHDDDYAFSMNSGVFENADHMTYFLYLTDTDLMTCGGFADYYIKNSHASSLFG